MNCFHRIDNKSNRDHQRLACKYDKIVLIYNWVDGRPPGLLTGAARVTEVPGTAVSTGYDHVSLQIHCTSSLRVLLWLVITLNIFRHQSDKWSEIRLKSKLQHDLTSVSSDCFHPEFFFYPLPISLFFEKRNSCNVSNFPTNLNHISFAKMLPQDISCQVSISQTSNCVQESWLDDRSGFLLS